MRDNIIFSEWSIKRIIAGAKTQTRRIVKPQPVFEQEVLAGPIMKTPSPAWVWSPKPDTHWYAWQSNDFEFSTSIGRDCPYTDRLYAKESFAVIGWAADEKLSEMNKCYQDQLVYKTETDKPLYYDWKSPLFMPRWASRIDLPLCDRRVERVVCISDDDAIAEGVEQNWLGDDCPPEYQNEYLDYSTRDLDTEPCYSAKESFGTLWNSLHAKPKRAKKNPYTGLAETCWVSYPFEDIRETRQHRGLPWYVVGNPWVWVLGWQKPVFRGQLKKADYGFSELREGVK